jgi:cytochrome P450
MFTMSTVEDHRTRKQLLARPYAKAHIVRGSVAATIEAKVDQFLHLLEKESGGTCDMGPLLSFFALDNATAFVYGPQQGTAALTGERKHRAILDDYAHPARRKLSWLGVHGGSRIKTSVLGALHGPRGRDLRSPTPFSNIRAFAMQAFGNYQSTDHMSSAQPAELSLISQLQNQSEKSEVAPLQDIDIASECADHLLAGIETTRNLLLFLIWALSIPDNERCQHKLRNELLSLEDSGLNDKGCPTVEAADKLPYLNAVLKEALRLYSPLPSSQPRFFDSDVVIEGYFIPAKTVVSMSPYTLHRNPDVFEDPYGFNPDRWLNKSDSEMKKWWWPFSSGGRMCTGLK